MNATYQKWMFKNPREEDLQTLTDEELLNLKEFILKRRSKHAAHLVRLLRMGIELMSTGELQVFREDASELKEIKTGKWTLEKVKKEADDLFKLAQEAFVRSPLPPKPDREGAEKLLVKIMQSELGSIDV